MEEVTYVSFSLLSSSCSFAALLNAYIYSPHDPSPLPPPFSLPFSIQSLSGRVATKPARGGKLRSSVRFGKVKRKSTHSLLLSYMQEEHPPPKKWASSAEMGSVKGDVQRRQQKGAVSSTHQRFLGGRDIGHVLQSVLHMCCCHASWTHKDRRMADYGGCRSREPIEERGHKRKKKGESCIGEGFIGPAKAPHQED